MQDAIQFGTDGIRGVAGQYPLSPGAVLAVGRGIGDWLSAQTRQPTVLIGRDTRPSGPHITHTLLAGLTAAGVTAHDAGVITTPGVAHLTRSLGYDMGIVISASHNPYNQNGIKLIGGDGFKLDDTQEEAIEALITQHLAGSVPLTAFGRVERASFQERYINHLTAGLAQDTLKGLSVVLDCANGASYAIAPQAFARLGATVTALGTSPTGHNINVRSGSEYVRRHRQTLLHTMTENDAQLGIAFDGDADRVILLTRSGHLIDGDHIMGLLATHLKAEGLLAGDTVVATTMSNSGLAYYLGQRGITLERTKVGDRYVMARMREGGFALGGEQAGHIIQLDPDHTAGDGVHIGLQVAALVVRQHDALEALAAEMPKFPQVIASVHLERRTPLAEVPGLAAIQEETLAAFSQQGRVNMRYSGTEPNLMRAMVEGGPKTSMDDVIRRALALCHAVAEVEQDSAPRIDIVDCATGAKIELDTYL